jgi:hypothetical protein
LGGVSSPFTTVPYPSRRGSVPRNSPILPLPQVLMRQQFKDTGSLWQQESPPPCVAFAPPSTGKSSHSISEGRPQFYDLLRRRGDPVFVAFDLLRLDNRDIRELPLIERKRLLRSIIPAQSRVLYADSMRYWSVISKRIFGREGRLCAASTAGATPAAPQVSSKLRRMIISCPTFPTTD